MISKLQQLKNAVLSAQQSAIFGSPEDKVIQACVDYLEYKGYRVVSPKKFSRKIINTRDLVEYFYRLLNTRNPNNFATSYNEIRDMKVAKTFVEQRMKATGASKEHTLNECGEIIKVIFDNYDSFNFKYEINFSVLGQGNLKWVTDKAIQLMNKKLSVQEEEDAEALREKALSTYSEPAGFSDLDEILKRMEEGN